MAQVSFSDLVDGVIHTAAHHNDRFNALKSRINAIQSDNLEDGSVTGPKIAMGGDAQGDTLIRGVTSYQRLAAGTYGQPFVTGGSGANPLYQGFSVAQIARTSYNDQVLGSTALPFDDTIPTFAEGALFMSQAITPKNANSILKIEIIFCGTCDTAAAVGFALFKDGVGTDPAIAAFHREAMSASSQVVANVSFVHYISAGSIIAQTFTVRAGTAAAGQVRMNGSANGAGARFYGAIPKSWISITEYAGA